MLNTEDADEMRELLKSLTAQAKETILGAEALAELREKIEALDMGAGFKRSMLKQVEALEDRRALTFSISNLAKQILQRAKQVGVNNADIEALTKLLERIESAI